MSETGLIDHPDGCPRCWWAGLDPLYVAYHDDEWGTPLHGDRELFERLSLEAFQSGLSWITILRRREGFRDAFAGFDPERIARFTEDDVTRLMGDTRIIRNRAKIQATVDNARAMMSSAPRLAELATSYEVIRERAPLSLADLPTSTPQAEAFARQLKSQGYRFVGPTSVYAFMQNIGLVNDHVHGCFRAVDHGTTAR